MDINIWGYVLAFLAGVGAILLFLVMSFVMLIRLFLEHEDIQG